MVFDFSNIINKIFMFVNKKKQRKTAVSNIAFTDIRNLLPVHTTRTWNQRNLSSIQKLVVHHTAIVSKEGKGLQEIKNIAKYDITPGPQNHISKKGCPGICYHWMIDRDGVIYKTSDLINVVWHCKGQNRITVGICLLGEFSEGKQKPSEKQLELLDKLLYHLLRELNMRKEDVFGHRDFRNTVCPGDNVYYHINIWKGRSKE